MDHHYTYKHGVIYQVTAKTLSPLPPATPTSITRDTSALKQYVCSPQWKQTLNALLPDVPNTGAATEALQAESQMQSMCYHFHQYYLSLKKIKLLDFLVLITPKLNMSNRNKIITSFT